VHNKSLHIIIIIITLWVFCYTQVDTMLFSALIKRQQSRTKEHI